MCVVTEECNLRCGTRANELTFIICSFFFFFFSHDLSGASRSRLYYIHLYRNADGWMAKQHACPCPCSPPTRLFRSMRKSRPSTDILSITRLAGDLFQATLLERRQKADGSQHMLPRFQRGTRVSLSHTPLPVPRHTCGAAATGSPVTEQQHPSQQSRSSGLLLYMCCCRSTGWAIQDCVTQHQI